MISFYFHMIFLCFCLACIIMQVGGPILYPDRYTLYIYDVLGWTFMALAVVCWWIHDLKGI